MRGGSAKLTYLVTVTQPKRDSDFAKLQRPTHRRESPRICVESSLKSHSRVTPSPAQ
ncbi:hypothetical protein PIB30_102707, partial [Stylosanthes scabra]|nr:hypothetical protein [Stylosanthes scabra]